LGGDILRYGIFRYLTLVLLILSFFGIPALAEEEACPEGDICIYIDAPDDHQSFYQSEDGQTYFFDVSGVEGRIMILYNQTTLYSQRLTYNPEERWAILEENVSVEQEDTQIEAVKATLNIDDNIYLFEEDVYVKQTGENPREIWTDLLHYFGDSRDMKAVGSVKIKDEKYTITAWMMEFFDESQTARFTGSEEQNVRIIEGKNDFSIAVVEITFGEKNNLLGWGPGRIVISNVRSSDSAEQADETANDQETLDQEGQVE
jgi:lipopolysaccharide export system protein LptC